MAKSRGVGVHSNAKLLNGDASKKKANFRSVEVPSSNGVDVEIPMSSVHEFKERLGNTIYGYILGKRVVYGLLRIMQRTLGLSMAFTKQC